MPRAYNLEPFQSENIGDCMKHKTMPDLNFLRNILDYNPDTGEFRWKVNVAYQVKASDIAGCIRIINNDKKYQIVIDKKQYLSHRIAYYYVTGIDPAEKQIDHKNGNGLDNRFINLRLAIHAENSKNYKKPINNTSGFKGVSWHKQNKKWQSNIKVNNKKIYLGTFNSKLYAAVVYARAEKHYFGEWRRDRKYING